MSVVIDMLIYVIFTVGVLVWFYYKHIPLSDVWARRIEIFGYILLIVIAIWAFAIKNVAFGDFYNDDLFWINEKLYHIFHGIVSLHDGSSFDTAQAWKSFFAAESSEYVQEQLFTVDCIEAVLQVLSAGCIGIGRLQELKNNKKVKARTTIKVAKGDGGKHRGKRE